MLFQSYFNVRKQKTASDGVIMCLQYMRKVKIQNLVKSREYSITGYVYYGCKRLE